MPEPSNIHDPYCTALVDKNLPTVGHFPREISRFVHFFLKRDGAICAHVTSKQRNGSPIKQGGLEILIMVTATHNNNETTSN